MGNKATDKQRGRGMSAIDPLRVRSIPCSDDRHHACRPLEFACSCECHVLVSEAASDDSVLTDRPAPIAGSSDGAADASVVSLPVGIARAAAGLAGVRTTGGESTDADQCVPLVTADGVGEVAGSHMPNAAAQTEPAELRPTGSTP